jgi:hypothetical protein
MRDPQKNEIKTDAGTSVLIIALLILLPLLIAGFFFQ